MNNTKNKTIFKNNLQQRHPLDYETIRQPTKTLDFRLSVAIATLRPTYAPIQVDSKHISNHAKIKHVFKRRNQ